MTPQFLWFRKVRSKVGALFAIAMVVNLGMWLERFVIVVTSLHRDFLPSSWGMYYPTRWDIFTFVRNDRTVPVPAVSLSSAILPLISIFEMRTLVATRKRRRRRTDARRANLFFDAWQEMQ